MLASLENQTMFRVVEKSLLGQGRRFHYIYGPWRERETQAYDDAERIRRSSLAVRMFICTPGGGNPGRVVDEIDLEPMRVRIERVDSLVRKALAAR